MRVLTVSVVTSTLCLVLFCCFPATGFSDDRFGAIACTRNCKQWSVANNHDTRAEAEAKAVAECERVHGTKCKVTLWFKNSCGALVSASSGTWGTDWGNSEEEAKQKALARCQNEGGKDCQVRCLECTEW